MKQVFPTWIFVLLSGALFSQEAAPMAKFMSSGNAYATIFFDYYYVIQGEDDYPGHSQYATNQRNDNAFSFRRVYLGYQYLFSEKFSGKVQVELNDLTTLNNGSRSFFLKEANLVWRDIFPMADLIIGHSQTPVWSIEGAEFYWRYRSIEATIADTRCLRSSNDSGLRIKGRFNPSGTLGYNFMIGNGNSSRSENDKYKLFYLNVWTKLLDQRLYLELFQDYNAASGARAIYSTKGLIVWNTAQFTAAVECINQFRKGFGSHGDNIHHRGISVFAHTNIIPQQLRVFGRFDSYNPDVTFSQHYEPESTTPFDEYFFTFGFDFIPAKNIHVMPNIWVNAYKNKATTQYTPQTEVVARLTFNVTLK